MWAEAFKTCTKRVCVRIAGPPPSGAADIEWCEIYPQDDRTICYPGILGGGGILCDVIDWVDG